MVIDNSKNSFAVSPSKKIIGIKILIKTTEVDNIANNTSFEPLIDAWNLDSPSSTFLWIFSSITIESSITNPVHRTNANNVIKFREKPKKLRKMNVDKIEIGTVRTGINVLFMFFRNLLPSWVSC